jgi:hypothetical protein
VRKKPGLEKASIHRHAVVDENKHRANGHVESILPEPGVCFGGVFSLGLELLVAQQRPKDKSR